MTVKMRALVIAAVAALALAPSAAWADTYVSPLLGVTFGGNSPATKTTFGAGITFAGSSVGLELEYAVTPNLFGTVGSNNLTTMTANIIGGGNVRGTGVKGFLVAGGGLIRSEVDSIATNDVGFDLGAGLSVIVASHVGVRGDLRYYRILKTGNPDFWRAAFSVLLAF